VIDVLVLGQPFQAARVVGLLNRGRDIRARVVATRDYGGLLAGRTRTDHLVVLRVGYRVGAPTTRGRLFDGFWGLLRRRHRSAVWAHYWLGSDVMRTVAEVRSGSIRRGPLDAARDDLHLSVAPWLTDELQSIGLPATTALLPPPREAPVVPPPLPERFAVLCYLPTHRFDFFRGDVILAAADQLPDVSFEVVGNRVLDVPDSPANVRWHGWVADMAARYAAVSAIVRIPTHDGFGNSVIEGLMFGRHVIYTYDVPFVHKLAPPTVEGLVTTLAGLRDRQITGGLPINEPGRAYALAAFDTDRLSEDLQAMIRNAV
jgi:hypothetical protein